AEVLPYLADANVLESLDDYEGSRTIPFIGALDQSGAFEGGGARPRWAVPFNRSTPIMYANGALLDEARVPMPRTWDELATAARALTRRSADGEMRWGFEVPISWWYWFALVGQAGGSIVDPSGRITLGGE